MPKALTRRQWEDALARHFAAECVAHSLPAREELPKFEEAQCQIIARTIMEWLEHDASDLVRERNLIRPDLDEGDRPNLIIISNLPGLVATSLLRDPDRPSFYYFSREGFDVFRQNYPDEDYRWHITYTSYFDDQPKPEDLPPIAAQDQLRPKERFLIHHRAFHLGRLFGQGDSHLWKWDGQKLSDMRNGFNRWMS